MESRLKELAANDGYTVTSHAGSKELTALYTLTNVEKVGTICVTGLEVYQNQGVISPTKSNGWKESESFDRLPELIEAKYKVFKQSMESTCGK